MNYKTEILCLWVGPESQSAAQHFYSLQAEQFFDEEDDPTNHQALWTLNNNHNIQKTPKMMVFDTKSDHLTRIRKVNHSKIIKKMSEVPKNLYQFNYFAPSQEQEEPLPVDQKACLFQNWSAKEDNYVIIDRKFTQDSRSFSHWESLYKAESDQYEDKIRKRLEKLDFLHVLSFCSDGTRLGFTKQLLSHFQDECPKKQILFTNLSQSKNQQYVQEVCLPLLSQISQQATILIDIDVTPFQFNYFQANFYHHFSPLYNCILTPFMLKNSSTFDYFNQVCSGKKSLFDIAFTLPIISENNELSQSTNIFNYAFDSQKSVSNEEEVINRINYANRSYLNFPKYHSKDQKPNKSDKIYQKVFLSSQKMSSQAYVLKGQFNEFSELCHQRTSQFDIKYLHGIFVANPQYKLNFSEFYKKPYGQKVEVFPMHSVLYQNNAFGPAIRNYLKQANSKLLKNELIDQWKQGMKNLSDLYGEQVSGDSD